MTSERLPGKVLRPVCGKPMLAYTLERLAKVSGSPRLVVATSDDRSDDEIVEFCGRLDVRCHRGPLNDVAQRFLQLIQETNPSCFVRICGDSPLIDPSIVGQAMEIFARKPLDLVTNVMPRSFPKGQSVEVIDSQAYASLYSGIDNDEDKEHATQAFYRNPSIWRIENFALDEDLSDINFSVDTGKDFTFFSELVTRMTSPHWDYTLEDILQLASSLPNGGS